MKLLHRTLIEASKRIITKRTTRTASPDTRRPPHTINSPFNISHPHKASSKPHLYILARTTTEGAIRKVSLTTYNDDGTIQSPGDSTGFIACSCPNASDASQHNHARLIPNTDQPTLKPGEHFVASTIVFPNVASEEPLQRGIDIFVKLPDGIRAAEELPRDRVLDEMHNALHDFGSTDIADQIYSIRFADKALSVMPLPSAPNRTPGNTPSDTSDDNITEHRANLSKSWTKGYPESPSQPLPPTMSMNPRRHKQTAFNPYHVNHEYITLDPQPQILVWTPHPNLAPSLDMALKKWDPALKLPMEKIKPSHKALICTAQPQCTKIEAVIGTEAMNTALQQITTYQMGKAELGDIRTATLGGEKPKALRTRHIMDAPPAVYGLLQSITTNKATETDDDYDAGADSDTQSESKHSEKSANWDNRPSRRTQRRHNNHSDSSDSQMRHKPYQQATACPICQMMFANPTAALQHVAQAHQDTPRTKTHNTPKKTDNTNNDKILKASQYNDNFVQVNLTDDDVAHFFQATAQTAKDPATNTRETRYIAPRFPNTIYDIEKLVAFENIPQKEMDAWYKAYQQVSQAKQLGSYRTYHTHNIGIENTSASLLIRGQKDTLNILKTQAPTLYPQRIAELNTHLVTRWFHNQRVYCLQNRIEWCSWFEICITERTAGREIYDRIMARLTAHPSAIDVLKTVSSFIEYTVTQLLPHPVPFYQRRQEIIDMHTSQLNSAVPSIDFTRQHLDANAEELKYLHPRYDATGTQTTQASNLLQATITDEILHEIIAQSPFFGRLHHLYLSDSQFQDIRQVPRAKILADLAKLIALDQATGQSPGVTTMKTTFKAGQQVREPYRCKACQALNVTCSDKHCKLHQPTITSTQAQRMKHNLQQNPAVLKANCPRCQNQQNTPSNSPKRRNSRGRSNTKSPHQKDKEQNQGRRQKNESRSNSRSRDSRKKNQSPPTRVRTILSNPERSHNNNNEETQRMQSQQTERRPYRETYKDAPPHQETTNDTHQQDEWRYANQNHQRPPYRQRWQQRSPTPNTRHDNYRPRSKSPYYRSNSPRPYRPRSQSANRYPPRSPPTNRFPRSRSVSNDSARKQNKQTPSDQQQ